MKLDKKQLPQLIILGVLVVVCVGFVSFQLMGSKNAVPPAPLHKPDKASTADAGQPAPGITDTVVGTDATGASTGINAEVVRRDPFQPVPLPTIAPECQQAEAPKPKPTTGVSHPIRPFGGFGRVPSIGESPTNPFSLVSNANKGSKAAEEEKDPEYTLTGVVRGGRNVAIIRSKDSGRHVVTQGQLIDGRYRVLNVTDDSATLIYKNRRIHVKLGGVKNAN